ncbi:hypothetical protein [Halosolutus halophilus]|uniref:hypothetical protein n=1 Tax=Halosolutus halophilus TaxID=1552990 RepID=UPI0022352551|nr:hypothetical protein [Halosolutus halophilus]
MTDSLTGHDDTTGVKTREEAAVLAYDTLTDAGCESVVTSMPHRTRSTWIVPATSESGAWRVHIDPRSGATRVVRSKG